jgi:hypothetical protein
MSVGVMKDYKLKQRNLRASHTPFTCSQVTRSRSSGIPMRPDSSLTIISTHAIFYRLKKRQKNVLLSWKIPKRAHKLRKLKKNGTIPKLLTNTPYFNVRFRNEYSLRARFLNRQTKLVHGIMFPLY